MADERQVGDSKRNEGNREGGAVSRDWIVTLEITVKDALYRDAAFEQVSACLRNAFDHYMLYDAEPVEQPGDNPYLLSGDELKRAEARVRCGGRTI